MKYPCFSVRDYLLGEHGAEELSVTQRIQLLGEWAKHNRFRSVREVVRG